MDIGKIALFGGAAYLIYRFVGQKIETPPAPATASDAAASSGVAFNSLDAIFRRVQAAAGNQPETGDQFNFYVNRELPAGQAAPDPASVFTYPGWTRETKMTLAQYWGAMAPYLKSNMGLSGLGFYAGMFGAGRAVQ